MGADELLAISQVPAAAGEELSLDLIAAGANLPLKVRVVESRPVIVNGVLRHRIRLTVATGNPDMQDTRDRMTTHG
jgi:hypothetical protein